MNMRLLVLLPMLAAPLSLTAQDSTARPLSPFRRGQWAAQFQAGTSFGSLGFIKFRSPTRALVVDLFVAGGHGETLRSDSGGTNQFIGVSSNANLQLRFGWRRYGGDGVGVKVVSNYTFGISAGLNHNASSASGLSEETNGWRAGIFGDVGGTYLLSPKFGIGALASASVFYQNNISTTSLGNKSRDWFLGGSALSASLVATLFF